MVLRHTVRWVRFIYDNANGAEKKVSSRGQPQRLELEGTASVARLSARLSRDCRSYRRRLVGVLLSSYFSWPLWLSVRNVRGNLVLQILIQLICLGE